MKSKPILYKIIPALFITEPIFKMLAFKMNTGFSWETILYNIGSRSGLKDIFEFWLMFPLAGIIILKINKWNYYLFNLTLLYIIYRLMTFQEMDWPYYSKDPFLYNYVVVLISIAVITMTQLPYLRTLFFNPRLRWWETEKRYRTDIIANIIIGEKVIEGKMENISLSGVYIRVKENDYPQLDNEKENEEKVVFHLDQEKFKIKAKILRSEELDSGRGLGFRFLNIGFVQKMRLFIKIKKLKSYYR
jgi:hypothetical protein